MHTFAEFLANLEEARGDHSVLEYDVAYVQRMEGRERQLAEAELVRLVAAGDAMAIEPAGLLQLEAAIPALERLKAHGGVWQRAAAGRALFHLRGEPMGTDDTGSLLLRGLDAFSLKRSPRKEAIPLLLDLLGDDSLHSRVHAFDGLVAKLGLQELAAPRGAPLHRIDLALSGKLEPQWQPAAREAFVVLSAVREGKPPAALDLVYQPSRDPSLLPALLKVMPTQEPFDLDGIRAMGRHDRAWAETALLGGLAWGQTRFLDAVRALDVPGWRDHVRAALAAMADRPAGLQLQEFQLACRAVLAT